ncbi:GDP/UDP-N,N'-diacetylbacillosamine 2-epimerase (hydrolysing) [Chitinophaga niastensis]|uniref:GDP/UDP-N,N'-diacetylbacillosamine 2-epimerase (Hydrolysing) n=1 Tax=Chitinophaga niastensis TaxID=536980 RepID=A0A2P8HRV0_CHINA|nr:UDP-N-acetylglucosamine 2-epimerase [Chitinophaga niastensis]PSL48950.1 GDP/UDP-N,N'-diacetylbacillosamine 2-epimerase (hydrolysing) [Chitinophaga niastensis]
MQKKKVLVVTGIRSEYDIVYPVLSHLSRRSEFEVKVVVSSAHLSDWHGYTVQRIEEDGFVIADRIDSLFMTNRETQRPKGVGILTYALAQTVEREAPDFLLVVGDREESIATAIVGNYMNVLTVHIGGGDPVWGNGDDPVRVAVSKLAHIHFTTTQNYADNLVNHLHEDAFRVLFTGNPAMSNIHNTPAISLQELSAYMNFDITDGNYIVLVKHPLSSEKDIAAEQMKIALDSLEVFAKKHNYKVVASYPNTDPGAYDILSVIKEFESKPFIHFNKTLPRLQFVNLLRHAKALAGNSSMGILEAPSYKLPVVNIGRRQQGRLTAGNVVFVDYQQDEIVHSLEKACFDETYRSYISGLQSPYENGDAALLMADFLSSVDPKDKKFLVKSNLC